MIGVPASVLGLQVSGDVAGFTIYTDRRGRKISYPAAPPRTAASDLQAYQRSRFSMAMAAWSALSPGARSDYALACRRLFLPCTATSLWCCLCLADSDVKWKTICSQSNLSLVQPPMV
jgi:hypothetical protein